MTEENNGTVGSEDVIWFEVVTHMFGLQLAFYTSRRCRNSSVSIVTAYGLNDRGSIPDRRKDFTLGRQVQTIRGPLPPSDPIVWEVISL
jgi:hypothetical protein